jgi:DNA-binding response OmpR family regulator
MQDGSAMQASNTMTQQPHVLVADDKTEMRGLIASVLRKDGYQVDEASDGLELLAVIESLVAHTEGRRSPIGMIISDVRMPGLTGLDLLAILRCADWTTPVILITAFGDDETHAQAHELGATAVFDKPFEIDELRAAVRDAVPQW